MNDIAIKIENLSKIYKLYPSHTHRLKEALHPFRRKYHTDFYALNNLNLIVKKSEVLGIVGRNGAGKSTLLKIISGVSPPTNGHLWVNGNISALLDLGSGFNPEFTGIENVFFSGSVMGFSRKQMDAKLPEIIAFADIGDFVYQPFKTYSSGMKTRLAFAVATSIDPEILIIDEVLSVGDELFRRKCYARIEKFMIERKTILVITHDIRTINELCTSALILDKGEIILIGPTKLVTTQYQRFIYAKPNSAQKIRNDIILLNQNDELKYAIAKESHKKNVRKRQKNDKSKYNERFIKEESENDSKVRNLIDFKSEYLPNLKPKSTVEYKNYDVEINDVEIRTLDGKIVNSLIMDEEYIYSYKVKFNIDAESVVFSMSIKNEKGSDLSSAKTAGKEIIRHVQKYKEYTIDWRFLCTLLPGTYYTNVGVTSFPKDDKFLILNRIIDAIAFKVQKNNEISYSGFCHLNQSVQISLNEEEFFKN